MTVLAVILVLAGTFFIGVSCVGMIRLPDFYTRAHAVGKSDTLGVMMILGGLAIYNGWAASTLKLLLILVFVMITSPTAVYALSRSALVTRLQPWIRTENTQPQRAEGDEAAGREQSGGDTR